MKSSLKVTVSCLAVALAAIALLAPSAFGAKPGNNGTTLAAYKTFDICEVNPPTDTEPAVWRYSGEIAVWNEGAIDTVGLQITDVIQYKLSSGPKWLDGYTITVVPALDPTNGLDVVIPAGTTQETARVFKYSVEGPALPGTIRNTANVTILNHSSSMGKPFGPSPKATWVGEVPPCPLPCGCTYTQGYWGNKPDVLWPSPYSRDAMFFGGTQTWQQVMDTKVSVSQGYYQLAHQYIAAVLNQANNACVPQGVQDTLNLASTWLSANGCAACTANGSCGLQKDWAAVLDSYNSGLYPTGPSHCGDE